uniref:Methyltransferase 4, N6-adenosine n=1 Tax=Lepisosteus oculatus TaxID=7918 RepID=W5MYW1_LEPOC|nr:PREDICTED: methyltransferase-like protein 4 isoform X1 [Lepisosteus oculatus]
MCCFNFLSTQSFSKIQSPSWHLSINEKHSSVPLPVIGLCCNMSVVLKNTKGWLLDQCSYINKSFQQCLSFISPQQKRNLRCRFKRKYFEILKPHILSKSLTNSDCLALGGAETVAQEERKITANSQKVSDEELPSITTKKRKRKHKELNQGESDLQVYHEKVRKVILEGSRALLDEGFTCGYFYSDKANEGSESVSRPSAGSRLADLCEMAKELPFATENEETSVQTVGEGANSTEHLDLFTRVTENNMDCSRLVTLMGEQYLLPPQCSFLLSDMSKMQPLLNYQKYDVIVLDPPWENKSVKRSNRYSFLPASQLKRIPVPGLSAPGCLVITWVTNRQKHLRFIREELYPHWSVEVLAEWLWVKITNSGEYVFPLDSPHKKPYEILVLGRYSGGKESSLRSSEKQEIPVPDQKLIVSVPSTLHSHKPSLADVLKEYVDPAAKCLELFARNLQPGWTSWGNEVLKFQHLSYFNVEETDPDILT